MCGVRSRKTKRVRLGTLLRATQNAQPRARFPGPVINQFFSLPAFTSRAHSAQPLHDGSESHQVKKAPGFRFA